MQRKGNPVTLWVGCKLVQPLWKTVWRFLKKSKIELPYNSEITLLGIYPKNTKILIRRDTYIPVFIIAVLSTIAKLWKQPKCPSTEEWMRKMWCVCVCVCVCVYNGILFSHKKNEILPFTKTWMELQSIMQWSKSEKEILYDFTPMWNLRNKTNKQMWKKERERQTKIQTLN